MKNFALILALLLVLSLDGLSQNSTNIEEYTFQSSGTAPAQLTAALQGTPKFISYPIGNLANFNTNSEQPIFDRLLCSGRLIYGNPSLNFNELKSALKEVNILSSSDQLLCLKSNESAVFSSNGTYIITTDLLSQSTNWENLIFLIIRAKVREDMKVNKELFRFSKAESIDDLVLQFYSLDLATEKVIDQKALKIYLEKGFNVVDAKRALDVLRFSDLPFEDYFVPTSYFDGKELFVPKYFLTFNDFEGATKTANQFGSETAKLDLQKRKDLLVETGENSTSVVSEPSKEFLEIRIQARLQIIEEQIIANKYEQALYSIFLMRKGETPAIHNYLDRMKAHAWYGLVRSRYSYKTKRYKQQLAKNNQSESNRFFHILKKFNSYAIAGLGLRYVTDIAEDNKEVAKEVLLLRQEMIYYLVESSRFPIENFSNTPFTNKGLLDKEETDSKYDKIEKANSSETIFSDSVEFYFYAIPDLISAPTFMANFNKKDSIIKEKQKKTESKVLVSEVYKFGKKGIKKDKSQVISNAISNDLLYLSKQSGTEVTPPAENSSENQLLELSEMNQLLLQNYMSERASKNVFPVSFARLGETVETNNSNKIYSQLVDRYKPKVKGYHYIGLLIVPLPFVLTDLFINGNRSNYLAFEYNPRTRKISYYENSSLTYPWNPQSSKAQIISTLQDVDHD